MSTFSKFVLALLVCIVIAFLNAVSSGLAMGIDMRADACRTFHTFSHQKELDTRQEIDGLFCGEASIKKDTAESVIVPPAVNVPPTVNVPPADVTPPAEDKRVTIDPQPNQPVTPPVVNPPAESVNGNPGNDKPVGNAGEKCDKGMCENSDGVTGEHGNSNND